MGGKVGDILKAAIIFAGIATGQAWLFKTLEGSVFKFFGKQLLMGAIMGAASLALQPKMPSQAELQGRTIAQRNPLTSRKIVYGRTRLSGAITYMEAVDDNKDLHMIVSFAGHEINAVKKVYFNDQLVKEDLSDGVQVTPDSDTTPDYSGKVNITAHFGTADQEADADLLADNTSANANFRQRGVAYIYTKMTFDQDVFPTGIPNVSVEIEGKKVYDPRTGTTVYSNNPALCIRDYLTDETYGLGASSDEIDDTLFTTAANVCDESVDLADGGSESRYTLNGVIDTSNSPNAILDQMITACAGTLYYANGKWKLRAGEYITPSDTLTVDDLRGAIKVDTRISGQSQFNAVKGIFVSPENNWQPTDYPEILSSTFEAEDGSERRYVDLTLPFTTSPSMAQRIAKQSLYRNREQIVVTLPCKLSAFKYEIGDTIMFTNERFGWTNKVFEVISWSLAPDAQNGTLGVDLVVKETSSAVYDWDENTDETQFTFNNTNLPNIADVSPPVGLSVTEELYTTSTGSGAKVRAILCWSAPADAFVRQYEVAYLNGSEWEFVTTTSGTSAHVNDLFAGDFQFRVRSINTLGVRSEWTTTTTIVLAGLTAPPSAVQNLSVRALDGSAHLQWDTITDLDVLHGGFIRIRHTPQTNGVTWEDGADIGKALAGTATNVVLPLLAGTYMAKAVDSAGNFSTSAVLATTTVPNILDFNAVETITESPSFSGDKDDLVVSGSVLQLDGAPNFILMEDGDNIVTEDGYQLETEVVNEAAVDSYGEYYFANGVDLGAVYTSRVTSNVRGSGFIVSDLIDQRADLIDDWLNFDGEPSDAVSTQLQIRTTEDDPTGTPTWSDWAQLLVGDYYARGMEFRLLFNSTDSSRNIAVSTLEVAVDMPDRNEKASGVAVDSTGTTINFSNEFKATPTIGITAQNLASGDYWVLSSQSESGFTINFYDASNNGISRTINWIATGYGKAA